MAVLTPSEHHGLIAAQARGLGDWRCVAPTVLRIGLGTAAEEGPSGLQPEEPGEVHVAPVHAVKRPGLWQEQIEAIDVVPFAVGNMEKGRDRAPQLQ